MATPALLITRPQAAAQETATAARAAGFTPIIAPLLTIRPLPFTAPAGPADAILFTSAETPPLCRQPTLLALPAWAVGERTARAAAAAGFRLHGTGDTDGTAIAGMMAAAGVRHALHPGGADRAPIDLPPALSLHQFPVYAADAVPALPDAAMQALQAADPPATLLFSPRTARIFATLADAAGLPRSRLTLVALSRKVADAAGPGWRQIAIAATPDSGGALAAARRLWQ